MTRVTAASVVFAALHGIACAQMSRGAAPPLQPLAQQVQQIEKALAYLGEPLSAEEVSRIDQAVTEPVESKAVARLQSILDAHVLAVVQINAESHLKVEPGPASPELVEAGTRIFLVKVVNQPGMTAQLKVESPSFPAVGEDWSLAATVLGFRRMLGDSAAVTAMLARLGRNLDRKTKKGGEAKCGSLFCWLI